MLFLVPHNTLTIKDLREVLDDLREGGFSDGNYRDIGLELGLRHRTLNIIKSDYSNANERLMECISRWLERADDVDEIGETNWTTLCNALEKINRAAAEYIS